VTTPRLVIWEGLDAWRAEVARVELGDGELSATGTQLGVEPLPYRLDYALEALDGFVTCPMTGTATGAARPRRTARRTCPRPAVRSPLWATRATSTSASRP